MIASLEVVVLPVADPDKSLDFYRNRLGFALDVDHWPTKNFRVVQLTPETSRTSIQFGLGLTDAAPGSVEGLYLVVSDITAVRHELVDRGCRCQFDQTQGRRRRAVAEAFPPRRRP